MAIPKLSLAPSAVRPLSSVGLASVLDQSVDCVKLVGLDGALHYMNGNGLCAMEIDDFCALEGTPWASLWPEDTRPTILASLKSADDGQISRFRAFCPTAKGDPRWWDVSVSPISDENGEQVGYLSVSRDVTDVETSREALEIAAAELKHRLANTYAMIGGLLRGFARGNPQSEAFADEMSDRLASLGRAQALFVSKDVPCDIEKLVPALLVPFERPDCNIVIGSLRSSVVDQGQADAIALTMGELAINSSKHGAIGNGGDIAVSAFVDTDTTTITWIEKAKTPVLAHSREGGQGLQLLDRLARARKGSIHFAWNDFGITVTLVFRH